MFRRTCNNHFEKKSIILLFDEIWKYTDLQVMRPQQLVRTPQ